MLHKIIYLLLTSLLFAGCASKAIANGQDPFALTKRQWLVSQLNLEAVKVFAKTQGVVSYNVMEDQNDLSGNIIIIGYEFAKEVKEENRKKILDQITLNINEHIQRLSFGKWAKLKFVDIDQ